MLHEGSQLDVAAVGGFLVAVGDHLDLADDRLFIAGRDGLALGQEHGPLGGQERRSWPCPAASRDSRPSCPAACRRTSAWAARNRSRPSWRRTAAAAGCGAGAGAAAGAGGLRGLGSACPWTPQAWLLSGLHCWPACGAVVCRSRRRGCGVSGFLHEKRRGTRATARPPRGRFLSWNPSCFFISTNLNLHETQVSFTRPSTSPPAKPTPVRPNRPERSILSTPVTLSSCAAGHFVTLCRRTCDMTARYS